MLSFKSAEVIRLGLASLFRHPGRTVLTMLGILFGVCSVIATMSIVEGISHRMQQEVLRMGATNIIIQAVKPSQDETASGGRSSYALTYGLTYRDAERIRSSIPGGEVVVPARVIPITARQATHNLRTRIIGTVPWYRETYALRVRPGGRWIESVDMHATAKVTVLGAAAAEALFPRQDPVGRVVRLEDDYYRVVGILEAQGRAGAKGSEIADYDSVAYIPLTTAGRRFSDLIIDRSAGSRRVEVIELHEITVKLTEPEQVEPAKRIITALLEKHHDPKQKDWEVHVPLERLQALERTKWLFVVLGVSIAAISLLVGGIGIMNIMLASVTERTREIGIRRAMGAKRRDIVSQFLVETVVLSAVGGLVGVPVGVLLARGIPGLLSKAATSLGVGGEAALMQLGTTIVTPGAVFLALGTSIVVGVASGLYPAYRAAQMDPIRALRHE